MVRQGTLTPSSAGSSPAVPAIFYRPGMQKFDPVAQPAEQLPFKQWVRGSNPRRVTTSEQASYRLLRLFLQKSERAHFAAPPLQIATAYAGLRFRFGCGTGVNEGRLLEQIFWTVPKAGPCFILKALLLQGICRDKLPVRIWTLKSKQLKMTAEAVENLKSEPRFPETELFYFLKNAFSYCSGV